MGRESALPLRQFGSDEEARMASKSLSFSSPESGLPGESWASAWAQKPRTRAKQRKRVFMVYMRVRVNFCLAAHIQGSCV